MLSGCPSEGGNTLGLAAVDSRFDPPAIHVTASGPVTLPFRNRGSIVHNLTIPDAGVDIDLEPGDGINVVFVPPRAGTLSAFCKYHREAGMTLDLRIG